jgi:hypothetical protein
MSKANLDSPTGSIPQFNGAQDALNRMKRACDRGTGCHLTAEMIQSLGCTFLGGCWQEKDPRRDLTND